MAALAVPHLVPEADNGIAKGFRTLHILPQQVKCQPEGGAAANARKLDAMRRRQKKTMQRYLCKFMEQGLYFPAGE